MQGDKRGSHTIWDCKYQHLPAVMWKPRNLAKLPDAKRRELADALERVLFP